jgi:hypothetical protein
MVMKEHNARAENIVEQTPVDVETTEPPEVEPERHRAIAASPRQDYEKTEVAAVRLGLDVQALRARCRRAAKKVGNDVIAHLGGGIVAVKLGSSWRIRFPAGR